MAFGDIFKRFLGGAAGRAEGLPDRLATVAGNAAERAVNQKIQETLTNAVPGLGVLALVSQLSGVVDKVQAGKGLNPNEKDKLIAAGLATATGMPTGLAEEALKKFRENPNITQSDFDQSLAKAGNEIGAAWGDAKKWGSSAWNSVTTAVSGAANTAATTLATAAAAVTTAMTPALAAAEPQQAQPVSVVASAPAAPPPAPTSLVAASAEMTAPPVKETAEPSKTQGLDSLVAANGQGGRFSSFQSGDWQIYDRARLEMEAAFKKAAEGKPAGPTVAPTWERSMAEIKGPFPEP